MISQNCLESCQSAIIIRLTKKRGHFCSIYYQFYSSKGLAIDHSSMPARSNSIWIFDHCRIQWEDNLLLKGLIAQLHRKQHHQIIAGPRSHLITRTRPHKILNTCTFPSHQSNFLVGIRDEHGRPFPWETVLLFHNSHRTLLALFQFLVQKQKLSVAWHNRRGIFSVVD